MSFPRAKIQRFNEISSETPAPGEYNVEIKKKATGAVISKSERFTETRSPALSEVSFVSSNSSTPCFRTPNPPKPQKNQHKPFLKTKSVELFQSSSELEALKDKIVECNNKDQTIKELSEQLEEMKNQLNNLETSICVYNTEREDCEEKIKTLKNEHEITLVDLKQKHQIEIEYYAEKIPSTEAELAEIKEKYEKLKQENRNELLVLLNNINTFEELYNNTVKNYQREIAAKENELQELKENFNNLKAEHARELEKINIKHAEEIQKVEIDMLQNITNIEKKIEKVQEENENQIQALKKLKNEEFAVLKSNFEQEKCQIKKDTEAKIRQMEENFKDASKLCEIQMKEKCEEIERNFQLKLAEQKTESQELLKECQTISEFTIIQCEIEKNTLKKDLEEKITQLKEISNDKNNLQKLYDDFSEKYKTLELKLKTATKELETVRSILQQEIGEHKRSLRQAESDKKAYDLALNKTHTTIEALKRRLINSDKDVEQLKAELESTEISKLALEERCNQLTCEMQLYVTLYKNAECCNEKNLKEAKESIKILENELNNKVDKLQQDSQEKHEILLKQLEEKENLLLTAKKHLKEQNQTNSKAQQLLTKSSQRLESLETENLEILNQKIMTEKQLSDLEKKYKALKEENTDLRRNYECDRDKMLRQQIKLQEAMQLAQELNEQTGNNENLFQENKALEYRIKELERKIFEQENLIGPFREQLEAYEMEYKVLVGQKCNIENEVKEMGLKYAELLGHQNQKQKIKYMVDLKKKNFELIENKENLEKKIRSQTRVIGKLKKDLENMNKVTPKKIHNVSDKENVMSPVGSPGPLRNRN